jgi:hypothetical protein
VRDDSLRQPRESLSKTDPELCRYRAAGAHAAHRYVFPGGDDAHNAFFEASLMENFSHAVVLEGDNPVGFVDVAAYVAPVTAGRLLVRRKSDEPSRERAAMDALEAAIRQPGGLEFLLGRLISGRVAEVAMQHPELVEQERRKALTELNELRSKPVPRNRMRWAIADTYRGIERAQLVVVNIRDESERAKGEALLAEVARLRKDQAVFDDVMGWGGNRVPITAVVANLTEPNDPGRKKALARIRRVIRPNELI